MHLFLEIKGDTQDIYFLYEHGAMALHKILEEKDFLCMLTCVFVHSGFGHLFSNMLVLLYIGDNVERALGKWKYLILYFISAIGANILVAIYDYNMNHMFAVTVGASGAIFGVIGGLLYMVCKNKGRLEDMTSTQLYIFLILSLYHGFNAVSINDVSQMGSNIAHFGGLAIGFFTAIFLYRSSKKVK